MPYFKSTCSSFWLGYYVQRQYSDVDPVIQQRFQMEEPFFWSDLPVCFDKRMAFLKAAHEYGVGQTGFSVPLTERADRKALFSVTSNLATPDWKAKIGQDRDLPLKIGDLLHCRAIKELYGTDEGPSFAPREIECLYWTARGKDAPTVAQILNICEYTVRDYLKSARHKLGCTTIAHTIHEAKKLRLIQFQPPLSAPQFIIRKSCSLIFGDYGDCRNMAISSTGE